MPPAKKTVPPAKKTAPAKKTKKTTLKGESKYRKSGFFAAPRKTKNNPKIYTLEDLKKIAKDEGQKYVGMKKEDLAKILKIKWVGSSDEDTKIPIYIGGKLCNGQSSKTRKNVLSKEQVIKMAVVNLNYMESKARTTKKDILCKELSTVDNVAIPKKESKKEKKEKPKKVTKKQQEVLDETIRFLEEEKDTEKRKEAKSSPKKNQKCIEKSKMAVHPYQAKLVDYLRHNRGAVAAFDVGTGKTLLAVVASQCIMSDNPKMKTIVVTQPGLKKNFLKAMDDYGLKEKDHEKYTFYSFVMFAKEFSKKECLENTFLIVDEAHYLKKNLNPIQTFSKINRDTAQAAIAVKCAKNVNKVLLLTATPYPNAPVDVVNLAAIVRGESELTEREFEKIVSDKEAFEAYFSCVFDFYKKPRTKDFPEQINHTIKLEMDEKYYKEYKKIEDKLVSVKGNVTKHGEIKTAFYNHIRQATNSIEPNPKIDYAIGLIKKGEKTIVYSEFTEMGINKIKQKLDKLGIKYVEVHGKIPMKKREEMKEKYNDKNSGINVMIITAAGGVGLDLKRTRKIIHLEKGWNPAAEEQVNGRGVRYRSHVDLPKSERKVDVYYLILTKPKISIIKKVCGKKYSECEKPSADEILSDIVEKKAVLSKKFGERLDKISINHVENNKCPPFKTKFEILRPLLGIKVKPGKGKGNKIIPML